MDFARFNYFILDVKKTVPIPLYRSLTLKQDEKMFHLANKHRLAIKVYGEYLLAVMNLDLTHSQVSLLEKFKPSKTNTVIKVVQFSHAVKIAVY